MVRKHASPSQKHASCKMQGDYEILYGTSSQDKDLKRLTVKHNG